MSKSCMRLPFLFLLLLCCVSPSRSFDFSVKSHDVVGLGACRPDQIQALTQFKNEFDTRRCNHSDSSNEGVMCDNSTGAITKLMLKACLSGTLMPNSNLFKLHHLRYLDLSENKFTSSSLPSEFGNLERSAITWKAVVIGYWPGVLFGIAIAHVVALYKPEWFIKNYDQNRLRGIRRL